MMEYWKSGIMGSGIMQCWINGPAADRIDDKNKMGYILLIRLRRTSIPLFHFRGNSQSSKKLYVISEL
jgi:hypothetical protein